jgi:integrase
MTLAETQNITRNAMATKLSSREATLADILASVESADLLSRQRDDLKSAVRTVARFLNAAPEQISANPRLLTMRLEKVSPQSAGTSAARFANIKSLLRRALQMHGVMVVPGRIIKPMTPAWRNLYQQLPSPAHRMRLSKFFRWLSMLAVEPADMTTAHFLEFGEELRENALLTKAEDAWRDIPWAWNSARRKIVGWPDVELSVPSRQRSYTLPWAAFAPSLGGDVRRYLELLSGNDHDDLPSPTRSKQSTCDTREWQMRAMASAIVHQGIAIHSLRTLADLVHVPHFTLGLKFFLARHNNQRSTMIGHLAAFMRAVAKDWVKVGPEDLIAIGDLVRRVTPDPQTGMTQKNRARLRVFDDPETLMAMLNLPQKLMQIANSRRYTAARSALLAQTAVAIELLLMRPIRLDNLRTLNLEKNFLRPRTSGRVHVFIPADNVKNEIDLEHCLPPQSAELLDAYLRCYRLQICGPENPYLFPGAKPGECKNITSLRNQIKGAIHRHVGIQMNPHLFRHFAAKLHLDANPGEYGIVSQVLGHKSPSTTTGFYTGLETDAAARKYQENVVRLRRDLQSQTQRRSRV